MPGNGVDDDNNGYVDDVYGVDLTTTEREPEPADGHGHGTHVAGIIAAAANGRGVVGVAPQAKIMTVQVLADDGRGTTGAVAEGIRYAAANGARVINVSLQGNDPDPRLNDAVAAAGAANALVVSRPATTRATSTAAVLSGGDPGPEPDRRRRHRARRRPRSGHLLELRPPDRPPRRARRPILSTTNDGGYGHKSGTSMAAPMVSGVAALMVSVEPEHLRRSTCARSCCSTPRAHSVAGRGRATSTRSAVRAGRDDGRRPRQHAAAAAADPARDDRGGGRRCRSPCSARRRLSAATASGSTAARSRAWRRAARRSR